MQYRNFGSTGAKVSALGFGTMRLPLLNGEQGSSSYGSEQVDAEKTIECIRYAVDHGVNYVDTAYNYMGGRSEEVVGQALRDGYRQKVWLATKSPTWLLEGPGDFRRILEEQLRKLQTDHIDMYLLHSLTDPFYREIVQKFGVLEQLCRAKEEGLVTNIGFSFHDELPVFLEILDALDWDFCQIQLNYVDTAHQAGLTGLRAAAARGMAISIMEPLRGGLLVRPPEAAQALFRQFGKTPIQFALEYLWSLPEVSTVLSGMCSLEQIRENIALAERSNTAVVTPEMEAAAAKAREIVHAANQIGCTGCRYCESKCPAGVPISAIFRDYHFYTNGNDDAAKNSYREHNGRACIQCRQCEKICPQSIAVTDWLRRVDGLLR